MNTIIEWFTELPGLICAYPLAATITWLTALVAVTQLVRWLRRR